MFALLIFGKLLYFSDWYYVLRACAFINDSIPERCIRLRQILRLRLRVMAFIAVLGFFMSQHPQRKFCFIAQFCALLLLMLFVSTEILVNCWISVLVCCSAAFCTVTTCWILVEQITFVFLVTTFGWEIVMFDIIGFFFGL